MNQYGRKSILVTAFEPFDGEKLNPTENILHRLPDAAEGFTIHKLLLPVEFHRSLELAVAAVDELSPDAVVMLGQAGGRRAVTPESTARGEAGERENRADQKRRLRHTKARRAFICSAGCPLLKKWCFV